MEVKHYQVMVISSQVELEAERRAVEETLVAHGAFVSGFSFPRLTDNYLLKLNQLCLASVDYAIILTNQQYSPSSAAGVGYVHQLYAAAAAKKIPIFSLIYKGMEKSAINEDDTRKLKEFVSLLKEGHYYEWHNLDGLRHATERGYEKLLENYKAKGWHRNENVIAADTKVVNSLKNQITLLQDALEKARSQKSSDYSESSDSNVSLDYQCKAFYGGTMKNLTGTVSWPLNRIFLAVAPQMMEETKESTIKIALQEQLLETEKMLLKKKVPQAHAFVDLRISTSTFNAIKVNLRAQSLVIVKQGKWELTPLGEHRLLSQAKAI